MNHNYKIIYSYNFYTGENIYKLWCNNVFTGLISNVDRHKYGSISNLFVEEQYRRNGYASYLLEHLENEQRKKKNKIIYVNSSKFAIPFYEKNGFIKCSSMSLIDKYIYKMDKAQYYKKL